MKKLIICLMILLVSGCTVVRIDTKSLDNTIAVVLSKNNKLHNRIGKGYKYYIPRGVNYIDTNEYNDKLYSDGNYYYLYIDAISYYYGKELDYEVNHNAYYSKKLDYNGHQGYVEINQQTSGKYLIEFMYNYAKIEALVDKDDIEKVILNSSYILSTIKFNNNVIKLMLDDDFFVNKEEKYDIFSTKENVDTSNYLEYSQDKGNEWGGLYGING